MSNNVNVCWLIGNYHQRIETLNKIKASLEDYSLAIYEGEYSLDYLHQGISELSCFDSKRLIILNDLPMHKGTKDKLSKKMQSVLEKVPDDCIVVLNNLDIFSNSILSFVKKIGKVFSFEQFIEKESAVFLFNKFASFVEL